MNTSNPSEVKTKEQLKAERRAAFEAKNAELLKNAQKEKPKSKSERRALQEAQRAVKNVKDPKINQNLAMEKQPKVVSKMESVKLENVVKDAKSLSLNEITKKSTSKLNENVKDEPKKVVKKSVTKPFPHIPHRIMDIDEFIKNGEIQALHPTIVKIGVRMNKGVLSGSTPRCVAMLAAFKSVISDYKTPPQKELCRDLKVLLDSCSNFLNNCRPLSISMKNALQMLNMNLTKLTPEISDTEAKERLISCIDEFIEEIRLALNAMSEYTLKKINDKNDVILTFGTSLSVKHILQSALKNNRKFRVIVVDCRPKLHAKEMLQFLLRNNVDVTYVYINAIAYVMKEVTKVIIGAHSILANGYVLAKLGTSQIALVAKAYNVPVIVCCEGFKFSEKVLTDSFVYNESGEGMDNFGSNQLLSNGNTDHSKIKINAKVNVVNLLYDVTPPDFVSMVVTESGIIPCNSVPAVIRRNVTKFH